MGFLNSRGPKSRLFTLKILLRIELSSTHCTMILVVIHHHAWPSMNKVLRRRPYRKAVLALEHDYQCEMSPGGGAPAYTSLSKHTLYILHAALRPRVA